MRQDRLGIRGFLHVIEWDARTRRILTEYRGTNAVTDLGVDLILERIRGNTAVGGISHYAIGTDSTPATSGQTALLGEAYRDLVTQTRVSGGIFYITLHLKSTQGNGVIYQEGGAFSVENIMLCRGVFPQREKTNLKELTVIHSLDLSAL